jgi:hypothetical protein
MLIGPNLSEAFLNWNSRKRICWEMIWVLVIGFVLSLVINESDAIELMDEIKKKLRLLLIRQ